MLSTRDIRRKINAVKNIEQICWAMKSIASIKLRQAEARLRAARPYQQRTQELLSRLGGAAPEHPLLTARPVEKAGIVLVTSDRGLCGSYNMNVIRRAEQAATQAEQVSFGCLGRKGDRFLRIRGRPIEFSVVPLSAASTFEEMAPLADRIVSLYLGRVWDRVQLVCTSFLSAIRFRVIAMDFLPIKLPVQVELEPGKTLFEPAPAQLVEQLLPRYLRALFYTALLESVASEHGSRVVAMTAATQNTEDLIRSLTLEYNKARQAGITSELIDIVGSAEAVA